MPPKFAEATEWSNGRFLAEGEARRRLSRRQSHLSSNAFSRVAAWLIAGAAKRHEVPFQLAGKERSVQKPYSSDRNVRMHHRRGRA